MAAAQIGSWTSRRTSALRQRSWLLQGRQVQPIDSLYCEYIADNKAVMSVDLTARK